MSHFVRWTARAMALALVIVSAAVQAAPVTRVVAFGDSLIDDGGGLMPERPPQPPSPPYAGGRYSNGPTPTEVAAALMGLPLASYAVSGAFSGLGNIDAPNPGDPGHATGVLEQVAQYLADGGGLANPDALHIVMGGSNDFLALLAGNPNPTLAEADALGQAVVANLTAAVGTLAASGARHFVLPLLPDIGAAPDVQDPLVSLFIAGVNDGLALAYGQLLALLGDPGIEFVVFDTFGVQHQVMPQFADTTQACLDAQTLAVCADPDGHFFWDGLHQSAAASRQLGQRLVAQVVPEPPMAALLLAAGIAAGTLRARRRFRR